MEGINLKTVIYILFALGWLYFKYIRRKTESDDSTVGKSIPDSGSVTHGQKSTIPMTETVSDKMNRDFIDSPNKEILIPDHNYKVEYAEDLFHKVLVDDLNRQNVKNEKMNDQTAKDEAPSSHSVLTDFDPKNMIIYHEIMKRPSY